MENSQHNRKPRKLIIIIAAAVFLIAAALICASITCVFVGGRFYPKGEVMDMRKGKISVSSYESVHEKYPESTILWNVPIGDGYYDCQSEEISVGNFDESEIANFAYLTKLRRVDASNADCYDVIMQAADAYPDVSFSWSVRLGDAAYPDDASELVLTAPAAADDIDAKLKYFPSLKSIDLRASALSDAEEAALAAAHPEVHCIYDIELCGHSFSSDAETVDLSKASADVPSLLAAGGYFSHVETLDLGKMELSFDDASALRDAYNGAAVHCTLRVYGQKVDSFAEELNFDDQSISDTGDAERAAELMPNLRKLYMDNCGLSDEELGALDDKFENLRVVWTVYIKGFACKTDADNFCISRITSHYGELGDEYVAPLKYCKDMVTLDLGHMDYTNIDFVKNMKHLKYFICGDTKVADISPLAYHDELYYLEMFLTPCTDVSPLATCKNLRHLNICYCKISDYNQLKQLNFLDRLWAKYTGLSNEQLAEVQEACPNTWVVYTNLDGDPSSVCYYWRCDMSYFDMRDNLGMIYMVAKPREWQ